MNTISIIIVHYKAEETLLTCLTSVFKSKTTVPYEVIIIDNGSKEQFEKELKKKFPKLVYHKTKKNIGFGAANNKGAEIAKGKYLFFLNPDTTIDEHTLEKLFTFLDKHTETAIAAPLLYHPDGKLFENQGVRTLTPLRALFSISLLHRFFPHNPIADSYWMRGWSKKEVRGVDVIPGTAFMISKKLFEDVFGFDETFFLYFEEFDLCRKIKKLGYSLFMIPHTKVVHYWGVSTNKKSDKDIIFQQSQEYYFKKYYGTVVAKILMFFLTFDKYSLLLLAIVIGGTFLRLYKITTLFMFIGDFGWFYLSAYDLITKGIVPLVSIPSSVVWLHQGPLATYFIAFSLWLGRMNPASPAVFFSSLDVITIVLVFLLGKKIMNVQTGIIASLLYATSPLVLINVRMPYHTSAIPFFACTIFLLTLTVLEKKKYYFWLFFLTGLLLQLELSNAVILLILFLLFFFYLKKELLTKRVIGESISGLLLGISPFILYDITHHFVQTIGFPLWVMNRVRLFLGLTTQGNATASSLPQVLLNTWEHIARILFPSSQLIVGFLSLTIIFVLGKLFLTEKNNFLHNKNFVLLLLWFFVPFISFIIHAAPGDAYFPFLFPAVILLTVYSLEVLFRKRFIILFLIVLLLSLFNAGYTISQDYFLSTESGVHLLQPGSYGFGPAFYIQDHIANVIAADAKGKSVSIKSGGSLSQFQTGGDQFRFLLLAKGISVVPQSDITYVIYEANSMLPPNEKIFYRNTFYIVTKRSTEFAMVQ